MALPQTKLVVVEIWNGAMLVPLPLPGMVGYGTVDSVTITPGVMLARVAETPVIGAPVLLVIAIARLLHSFGPIAPSPLPAPIVPTTSA